MELIETILCYSFSLTNIFLFLYLIMYIYQKRKVYPFSKTSPLCSILFIICLFFHQFLYFIMCWLVYRDDISSQKLIKTINSINTHCLFIIPIYYRMKFLTPLVKYNFYHLTYNSQSPSFDLEKSNEFYNQLKHNSNPDFSSATKGFILLIILNSLFLFLLSTNLKCILYHFSNYTPESFFDSICEFYNTKNFLIIAHFIRQFIFYVEILYFLNKLCELWKYPIKSDIFYIRLEMTVNFSWFIFHGLLYHYYALFNDTVNFFGTIIYNDLIDFSIVVLHLFIVQLRKKKKIKSKGMEAIMINKPPYIKMINQYGKFMRNFICFTFFKKYINDKNQYKFGNKYLKFYVDFYLFKLHLKRPNTLKKTDLIIHAYYLYSTYFRRGGKNENTFLDIPSENSDDIEKGSQVGFCLPRTKLNTIFDEAFRYINNKLYNIYAIIMNHRYENKMINNLLSHTEFDEVKEEVLKEFYD